VGSWIALASIYEEGINEGFSSDVTISANTSEIGHLFLLRLCLRSGVQVVKALLISR